MLRRVLKSKIHRVTVTEADVNYEGSVTIDSALMDAADILPWEEVFLWNVTNGERLTTYAIPAPPHSGTICINGAGAHKARKGDVIIIATYTSMEDADLKHYEPRKVFVDAQNRKSVS